MLLLGVRGVVVETTILGIGNTDGVAKLVMIFSLLLEGRFFRLAIKTAQSNI